MPIFYNNNIFGQPPQAIPSEEKDERWKRANMDWAEQFLKTELAVKKEKLRKNYNIANGIIDVADYVNINESDYSQYYDAIQRNVQESIFTDNEVVVPEDLKFFPIVPVVINLLVGEMLKRYDFVKVAAVDDKSTNEYWEYKKEMIVQYLQQKAQEKVAQVMEEQGIDMESEEGQQQFEQGVQQALSLPGIQKFMNRTYKNNFEEWANRILEQAHHKYKLFEKEAEIIKHELISDEAYLHIVIDEDDLDVEVWNPEEVAVLKTPHVKYTNKASFVGRQYYTTIDQVISRYKNKIQAEMVEKYNSPLGVSPILSGRQVSPDDNRTGMVQEKQLMFFKYMLGNNELSMTTRVMVTEAYWVTQRRMIHLKAVYDGQYVEQILDDNFEPTIKPVYDKDKNLIAGEEIEYFYAPQIYQGTKLNFSLGSVPSNVLDENKYLEDQIFKKNKPPKQVGKVKDKLLKEDISKGWLYIDVKPTDYQFTDSVNPWKPLIPVVGCYGFEPNMNIGYPYSIVDKTKAYQVMFNACMNQVDNFMKTEIGLFYVMDKKLIPRDSLDGTVNGNPLEWLLQASDTGLGTVDSSPSNTQGGNIFQQPAVINLLKNPQFQSRLELAQAFKTLLFETIGITPQRLGSVQERETATGITQAVNNSYAQTEQIFFNHANLMREFKEMLLDAEKYMESKKPVSRVQYYNSDEENLIFELDTKDLMLRRFNIFLTTKPDTPRILEQLRQMAIQDNTTGASLLDKAEIIESSNVRNIKDTLAASLRKLEEQQQAQRQAEQEALQQQLAAQAEEAERERAFKVEENEKDRVKDMYIAEVRALGFARDNDIDNSGVHDALEVAKFNAQTQKNYTDMINAQTEQQRKQNLDNNKISLERQKLMDKQNERLSKERIKEKEIRRDILNQKNDIEIARIQAAAKKKDAAARKSK